MTTLRSQTIHRAFLVAGLLLLTLAGCDDGDSGLVVTGEYPVIWVERPIPREEVTEGVGDVLPDNLRDPGEFRPGARLMLKRRAAPAAPAIDITTRLFAAGERYDVRDVSPNWDGTKILFALRGPYIDDADDDEQPTWNIWEYDIAGDALRRVIASRLIAEEGHDIMPAYLPDGRIVFSSNRQRASRAVLVDEGKPQFAMLDDDDNEVFVLHVMAADGSDIHQISFNAAHDLFPTVMNNGRVLFSRQVQVGGRVAMHLYSVRPDGRDLAPAFGGNSHDSAPDRAGRAQQVQFAKPRLLDDGRVLVIERPYETEFFGGALAVIDIDSFSDETRRIDGSVANGGISAIDMSAFPGERLPSRAGRYADAVPLADGTGRLLVSWSACRLQAVAATPPRSVPCAGNAIEDSDAWRAQWREAPPIYGVFVLDPADGSRLPVVVPREETMFEHVAVVTPRPLATYLPDAEPGVDVDQAWFDEGVGVLDIRSVYDLDGAFSAITNPGPPFTSIGAFANPATATAAQRPARWLRIEKIVAIPDRDVRDISPRAFGVNAGNGMREILGYTPIEPDGSVRVKVPANVPFTFSILDRNGQRLTTRHTAWLQLVPGEERQCAGCHSALSNAPHGRGDSGIAPLHAGAAGGAPFPNTDPAKVANAGETMAQLRARLDEDTLAPSVDVLFTDIWTDAGLRAPDAPLAWLYADLATPVPTSAACQAAWAPLCRVTIHYETHIHPLWSRDRRVFDTDGVTELENHTCTRSGCHNSRDAADMQVVPDAQLDLRDGYSGEVAEHMSAYRELLAADNEQELDAETGTLVDVLVPVRDGGGNIVYQTNEDGTFVLDELGQRVPERTTVRVPAPLVAGNARASTRFFTLFRTGTHAGRLSEAELRLVSEWVDIGAQYYNDPFTAPEN
jgi:hypothetical protein